ncbi:hypothetical protein [Actinoplanes sp. NPDC026670]|uniref:hypothetical protein n=1 Tax=Actinoplanes sp. NPDC026670 TaxID=3154700 RepID=UPI0033D39FB2
MWIAIVMLAAAFIGGIGGLLSWLQAGSVPQALLVAGGAAGGVMALAVGAAALFRRPSR